MLARVKKLNIKLFVLILSAITISVYLSALSYSIVLLMFIFLFFCAFFFYEIKKYGQLLTLGNVFNVYWFFYTSAFWINYQLGFNREYELDLFYFMTIFSIINFFVFHLAYSFGFHVKEYKFTVNENFFSIVIPFIVIVAAITLLYEIYIIFIEIGIDRFINVSRPQRSALYLELGVLPFSDILILLSTICFAIAQLYKSRFVKVLFLLLFMNNIAYSFVIIDRSTMLKVILPILFISLVFKKISTRIVVFIAFVGFFYMMFFKELMSSIIYSHPLNIAQFKINGEFERWYLVGLDVINDLNSGRLEMLYGRSYWDTLYNLIVPFTNVEPLSVWYVREYYPEVYEAGGGLAFSSIVEGIMNFGLIGPVLYFFFLGFICRFINKRSFYDFKYFVLYSLVLTVVYKFFRAESYSLFKTTYWLWFLPLFLLFFVSNRIAMMMKTRNKDFSRKF